VRFDVNNYLHDNPASKIISIREHSITTTKLEAVVAIVAGAAGVPTTGITHYHFGYPSAENILLVYEDPSNGLDFTIQMPGTYAYFERGFAKAGGGSVYFNLNGVGLPTTFYTNYAGYGVISAAQLAPDVTHTLSCGTSDHGVLMIIYTEP
jgi:hypothetical protein